MSEEVENTLNQLKKAIEEGEERKIVKQLESKLSQNIQILSKIPSFYSLPIYNIAKIIKNVDFSIQNNSYELLQDIISNLSKENKDALLILKSINCKLLDFTIEQCINLLSLFGNCQLFTKIVRMFNELQKLPDVDYDYEINQKQDEIKQMKEFIDRHNLYYVPLIKSKPLDFERNIHKACEEGKLSSVQYLIEHEHIDKNLRNEEGYCPIHIACWKGHLPIVRYLIEIQNVNKEENDNNRSTPLMFAVSNSLEVVQYLIEKQKANCFS